MAHDVFISYSKNDKVNADAICSRLEAQGIRCWIAPRDVLPGAEYAAAIVDAIAAAKVMVVVFSSSANESVHIKKEVERAINKGVSIIPVRIEDVKPSQAMEYYISTQHWLDALTPPLEEHIDRLAQSLKALLQKTSEAPPPPAATPGGPAPAVAARTAPDAQSAKDKKRWLTAGAASLVIVLAAALAYLLATRPSQPSDVGPLQTPPPAAEQSLGSPAPVAEEPQEPPPGAAEEPQEPPPPAAEEPQEPPPGAGDETLRPALPPVGIVLYIRSAGAPLYLHASGGSLPGALATLHPCPKEGDHPNCQWSLEESPTTEGAYYIKTTGALLYLHAINGAILGAEETLHRCPQENDHPNCQWFFEESPTRPGAFYVKSAGAELYLHAHGGAELGAKETLYPCPKEVDYPNCQWFVERAGS